MNTFTKSFAREWGQRQRRRRLPSSQLRRRWVLSLVVISALAAVGVVAPAAPRAEAINNGSAAGNHPYVARIITRGSITCTGTLIKPEWVLTAGHCVDALRPWSHTVSMGTSTEGTLRNYPVSGVRRHPAWPRQTGAHPRFDIALIRLARPVTDISPARLGSATHAHLFNSNDDARAIGWGTTSTNGPLAATLQSKAGKVSTSGDVLNATFTRGGPCPGDSGSPLLVNVGTGPIVVGNLSAAGCEDGTATYTDVAMGPAHDWMWSVLRPKSWSILAGVLTNDAGVSEQTERPWTAGPAPVQRVCFDAGERDLAAEPANLIDGRPAYRTSWWVYDPGPNARSFRVTTAGSAVDTVAAVYQSTGDTLQYDLMKRLWSNNDSGGTAQSSIRGTTMANKPGELVYLIGVGTYSQAATGQVCVQLVEYAPGPPVPVGRPLPPALRPPLR